ncbi:hypothetical protein IAG44_20120 [Streptomyces roseirectus]|uniref:Uncharacterized protein n=1 Tax=Streptomyces roseirectus TaxID=2768066 RepID=A0A7H0IFE1_9ACTN|nr:hypothetical protein [Streptomyces roseirectus]QNP71507.1 hypothetical protein IAG44_20120 [Streptomyces roseirectus]
MYDTPLYLARLDMYARFLTAVDAESHVVWHRQDGRYADEREAIDAVDRAYAATRAAFNPIDLEGTGPHKEARLLLEQLKALHRDGGENPDWKSFKAARETFVTAAKGCLEELRDE